MDRDDGVGAEFFNYPALDNLPRGTYPEGRESACNTQSGGLISAGTNHSRLLKASQANGYYVSTIHVVNIIPSYTEYFELTAVTLGLNAASMIVGRFFGILSTRTVANRLGRRTAIFWGAVVTLAGVAV